MGINAHLSEDYSGCFVIDCIKPQFPDTDSAVYASSIFGMIAVIAIVIMWVLCDAMVAGSIGVRVVYDVKLRFEVRQHDNHSLH